MATKLAPQRIRAINSPTAGQVPSFSSDDQFEWVDWWSGWGGNIVFVSDPIASVTDGTIQTFTHNLWVTQADIEAGRYDISFTFKIPSDKWNIRWTIYWGGSDGTVDHVWSAIDPISKEQLHRQANTLKSLANTSWQTFVDLRCIIEDLRLQTGGLGSGAGNTVYISEVQDVIAPNVYTITHNLSVTQADVESGRYKVMFSYQQTVWAYWYFEPAVRISGVGDAFWRWFRDSTDPAVPSDIHWQENSLKFITGDDANNVRVHIIDTRVTNAKAGVNDTAYWPSRDGVTTEAPSMNAVYDKIESMIWWIAIPIAGSLYTLCSAPTERIITWPVGWGWIPIQVKEITINTSWEYTLNYEWKATTWWWPTAIYVKKNWVDIYSHWSAVPSWNAASETVTVNSWDVITRWAYAFQTPDQAWVRNVVVNYSVSYWFTGTVNQD